MTDTALNSDDTQVNSGDVSLGANTNASTTTTTIDSGTDWRSGLPDDIKTDKSLESIKDVTSLAKGYVSSQRMLGGRIPIPSEDASPEVKAEFYQKVTAMPNIVKLPDATDPQAEEALGQVYTKLGRPTTPDKYSLNVPEDIDVDKDYLDNVKKIAHKAGLNSKQLQALTDHEVGRAKQMMDMMRKQKEGTVTFLKNEWGNQFEENKAAYKGLMSNYAKKFPDAVAELQNGYAGNNPVVIMMAAELGKIYQQNGTISPHKGASNSNSPEQAKQHIADIFSNKTHAYHNDKDPGHEEAVRKVQSLYRDAYPE